MDSRPIPGRPLWLVLFSLLLIGSRSQALTITEIMYHPPDGGPNLQYVEVFNDAGTPVDLSGWFFSKGIQFVFPEETFLDGRSYLVVCGDEGAVAAKYGISNTIGNFTGNLENHGETLEIVDNSSVVQVSVSYKDRGKWTAVPGGTGHSLSLQSPFLDPAEPLNWVPSREMFGTPGQRNFPPGEPGVEISTIFPATTIWKYKKGIQEFSSPISAWRGSPYVETGWLSGQAGIGYAPPGDHEMAYLTTLLPDMNGLYPSVAFRKTFYLSASQKAKIETLILGMNYDDGFVAYLNGTEVARSLDFGNPGQDMTFNTPAPLHESGIEEPFTVQKSALIAGNNVLAIQVHNAALSGSTDFVFAPRLYSQNGADTGQVVFNELLSRSSGERWVELYNTGTDPVALAGYFLSDSAAQLAKYAIPPDTTLAGHGFLVLNEAESGLVLDGAEVKLFLTLPDQSRVADAHIFENPPQPDLTGMSDARFPDGGPNWVRTPTPTRGAADQYLAETDIVIDEILYNPFSSRMAANQPMEVRPGEYIEIHNKGTRTVSLRGFAFTKGIEFAFADDAAIGQGGYLVVAQDPDYIKATYGITNVVGPWTGELKDSGETIRLEDPVGNTVDEVKYADGGDWPELADGGGSSLELIDPRQDNSMGSAWEASDESGKTSWTFLTYSGTYSLSPAYDSESALHFTPLDGGFSSFLLDDVEALNGGRNYIPNGGFETTTDPWLIQGTLSHSRRRIGEAHTGSACLEVIATGQGDLRDNRLVAPTSPAMPNGSYQVRFWARWLGGGNLFLVQCFNNEMAKTFWLPVPRDLGTPGRENGATARLRAAVGSVNLGPVIGGVHQRPVRPAPNQIVTVSASAADADGLASIDLLYRFNDRGNGVFNRIPMSDSGGAYTATIPGFALGTRVLFFIEAADATGQTRRYPVNAPEHTLLYQVDDPFSSSLPVYRLSMDEDNRLYLENRQLHSDDPVYGSLVFDDTEIYYNVGLHYHGSPWNRPGWPRMFKLYFPGDRPFHGVKKLNISRYGSAVNEAMAYHTIARSGRPDSPSPASDYRFIRWRLNGSDKGNMSHVETVDSTYASRRFGPDSLLFKAMGRITFRLVENIPIPDPSQWIITSWASLAYRGTDDKEAYRGNFDLHSRQLEDDFGPLVAWLKAMDVAGSDETQVRQLLDFDEFLRVEAIRAMNDDWDGVGIGNGQNTYFCYSANEGRWKLVPWDMDHTFYTSSATTLITQESPDPGVKHLLSRGEFRRIYLQSFQDTLDHIWTDSHLNAFLDPLTAKGIGGADGVRNFIKVGSPAGPPSRISVITSAIGTPATFRITTKDNTAVATTTTYISGSAPLSVRTLLMNWDAIAYPDLNWLSYAGWRVKVPLVSGKNHFEFQGLDGEGNLIGSGAVNIYSTYQWVAPTIQEIRPASGPPSGGTQVTITGSNFHEGITAAFGTAGSPSVVLVSDSEIIARTPAGLGQVDVKVTNVDKRYAMKSMAFLFGSSFLRGDGDRDGAVTIGDAIKTLSYLYLGDSLGCLDAADSNDDGKVDLSDPIRIVFFLFAGGLPLPPPSVDLGLDPTQDSLDCADAH